MNKYQSAYKHGQYTESALLKLQKNTFKNMACGKCTALALVDLSVVFDTIDHNILSSRLFSVFGLEGTVSRWFTSYLAGRV